MTAIVKSPLRCPACGTHDKFMNGDCVACNSAFQQATVGVDLAAGQDFSVEVVYNSDGSHFRREKGGIRWHRIWGAVRPW